MKIVKSVMDDDDDVNPQHLDAGLVSRVLFQGSNFKLNLMINSI